MAAVRRGYAGGGGLVGMTALIEEYLRELRARQVVHGGQDHRFPFSRPSRPRLIPGHGTYPGGVVLAPEGRRLLRIEARNSQVPIERKPEWIKTRLRTGPEYTALKELVRGQGPAHGLRGGGLPQHLRVLGGPRGHVPDRRRRLHPAVRLLPDRHRQAGAARYRRAAPGGRVGRRDGPALRHGHRGGPRRPARRRRLAVRPDLRGDPRRPARLRRRAPHSRFQRRSGTAGGGVRIHARGACPQHRNRPADLPPDQARLPL